MPMHSSPHQRESDVDFGQEARLIPGKRFAFHFHLTGHRTVIEYHGVQHCKPVDHFGMHYGQIVFITKLVRADDLDFYRELDKTGRLP
jgi:hypothetical protein